MKKLLLIALALVPLLSFAQDDMYFTPKKADKTTKKTNVVRRNNYAVSEAAPLAVYSNNNRSDDEYNRRFTYNNGHIVGNDDWQEGGSRADKDSIQAESDSIMATYSRDMNDYEDDYYYSRRLLRFHSPRFISMRSPFYWDLVYGYGCYDYLDYWYDDPFFWNYGWGYGWSWGPWSCWYGPMWGYAHPHHWDYWGWGGSWGHPVSGPGDYMGGKSHRLSDQIGGIRFRDNPFGNRNGGSNVRTQNYSGGTLTRSPKPTNVGYASNRGSRDGGTRVSRLSQSVGANGRATSYGLNRNGVNRSSNTASNSVSRANSYGSRPNATTSSRVNNSSSRVNNTTTRSNTYSNNSSSYSSSRSSSSSGSFGGGSSSGGGSHSGGGGFSGGGHSGGGRR